VTTRRSFDQRSAAERAVDERYENFLIHFLDDEKRKRYRPRWQDVEAVVDLFRDETLGDWLQDHLHKFPTPEEEVIERARQGDLTALIRRRRRRGERGPTSKWKRLLKRPVHAAAAILPDIEYFLRWVYPEQTRADIRDRALLVAEDMTGAEVKTIERYLSRPKKDRRRLV
jgi:hypothetical protein